ncbi:MAG TPA: beta-ketoacyl synthase N-terminal-like domain-containing protein, partial [Thermoanaerobaculia bacterium]|nr:beta-ketoacyl synthase N-terminal-like domain-containing protein [Thermoanaerobaculia bacterium]
VWAEVLECDEVAADGSFFDQGGNSLLLTQVHVRLQEVFERDIPMVLMFRHPTVDELAEALVPEDEKAAVATSEPERAEPATAPAVDARPREGSFGGAVAVVGMAGRFPGAADLDAFWQLLDEGRSGIRFFSDEELLAAGVDPARLDDDHYVKGRGALDDADSFDAPFFDVSPREAQVLDPQQRVFLEVAWAALEDAGRPPRAGGGKGGKQGGRTASDRRVGVFAGVSENDYDRRLADNPEVWNAVGRFQIRLGNQLDYVATRLSYKLDLTGPALTVLTACSTSLVAVHLACRALAAGDCDLAVAGGASVASREVSGYPFLDGGIDSPDGHTRAFDADAAGTVTGSGCGAVVLKRLEDALADGDQIRAVVRGSAVNNDGAGKVGFTAPSVAGQAAVIRAAQQAAGVEAASVSYVEAHGTGTPMGDPIEIAGLKQAWSDGGGDVASGSAAPGSVAIGSVKTNVGHLDAAAGVVALIKTVLALEHERIPPSLHFRRPNPELELDGSPFRIAAEAAEWPRGDAPRRAGVSSFGIGGTNAHLVVEEAPQREPADDARPPRPAQLLLVSARSAGAADRAVERLAAWAGRQPEGESLVAERPRGEERRHARLADAAYTLDAGRRRFAHRRAVVARSFADAAEALAGDDPRRRLAGEAGSASGSDTPPLVFCFPGQGAQYPGMGGDLYAEEPVFRDAADRCFELLRQREDLDLRGVLYPPAGSDQEATAADDGDRLTATELAQPALFTVCWALAELLESWGLVPEATIGHSIGEYVAAARAGVFELADALSLVTARGRLMASLPPGDMLAVRLPETEIAPWLERHPEVALAAVNTADAVVVSGASPAVAALARDLEAAGTEVRELHTSHAFHSPMMEPILEEFAERVAAAKPRAPRGRFVSNVTGSWITDAQATDPAYWAGHLRGCVRFADGLETLLADEGLKAGRRALVEVGPGRTLSTFARRHPKREAVAVAARTLPHPKENAGDLVTLLDAVGRLWTAGVETDAERFWAGQQRHRTSLPTYPFERRRYSYDEVEAAPEPQAPADGEGEAASGDAPHEGTEATVAAAWEALLGVSGVGRHDDFFDLGGSSLAGVGLASKLGAEFEVELPGSFLLEAATVAEQAAMIDRRRAG